MANGRIFFNIFLLACAAWAFATAQTLPKAYSPGQIGPDFFPSVVAGLGVLIVLGILWEDIKALRRKAVPQIDDIDFKTAVGAAAIFALLVLYIFMIQILGFRVSTGAFLFAAMMVCHVILDPERQNRLFDPKFAGVAAVAAILSTLTTYAVFTYGFGLNLS